MPLRDIVKQKLVSCRLETPVREVAKIMDAENVGAVLVVNEGKPAGIVTDRDLALRCVARTVEAEALTAEEVMTPSVESVSDDQGIYNAIHSMKNGLVRRIAVVNEAGTVTALLSFDDLFTLIADEIQELRDLVRPADGKWEKNVA
jgi:signal-transduction protein with cAMP-binding, CBS, and nucleotidyltransferase domain